MSTGENVQKWTQRHHAIYLSNFQRVRATSMTQRQVENTPVHFWTFSPVSVKVFDIIKDLIQSYCNLKAEISIFKTTWQNLSSQMILLIKKIVCFFILLRSKNKVEILFKHCRELSRFEGKLEMKIIFNHYNIPNSKWRNNI